MISIEAPLRCLILLVFLDKFCLGLVDLTLKDRGKDHVKNAFESHSRSYRDAENMVKQNIDFDCDKEVTLNHARFMLTNYRALLTFMHEVQKKSSRGQKDGSIMFLNWQDGSLKLKLPKSCAKSGNFMNLIVYFGVDKKEEDRKEGKYAKTRKNTMLSFENDYKEIGDKDEFHMRAFPQRNYYRTVTLFNKDKVPIHHFNMFTRPLGYTTFPVPSYLDEFIKFNPIDCEMKKVKEMLHDEELVLPNHPYRFFWKFPLPGENDIPDNEKIAPTSDILHWAESKGFKGNPVNLTHKTDVGKITFEDDKTGKNKTCQYMQHSTLTVRSYHDESSNNAIMEYQLTAGRLACIAMDRYGLSSAYWWENDDVAHSAPEDAPFRGFANNRTRSLIPLWLAIGIIIFMLIVTILMIFFGKQWNEDRSFYDKPPVDAAAAIGAQEGQTAVAEVPKSGSTEGEGQAPTHESHHPHHHHHGGTHEPDELDKKHN